MFAPLIGWIRTVLASVFAWIASAFGKKVAVAVVATGVWVAASAALLLSMNTIINSLIQSMPGGLIASSISMLPSNTTQCITAVLSTHGVCFLFEVQNKFLNFKARA